jgi:hypothetical protein
MVRQESDIEKTYNINIKTPVIVYNCLPCTIHLQTPRPKEVLRDSHPETNIVEEEEATIPRGQKLELFNYNFQQPIKFSLNLDIGDS